MTIAFRAYLPRIVAFPRLEMVPLLIPAVVVPRVGGLDTIFFQEQHLGIQATGHSPARRSARSDCIRRTPYGLGSVKVKSRVSDKSDNLV